MSKTFNGINIKLENSNQKINNNSINNPCLDNQIKNYISNLLIFFKEDILKDVKQLGTEMDSKYKLSINKNDIKIIKMQEAIEAIQKNLEKITTPKNKENPLLECTDKMTKQISKLEQTVNAQNLKIKNISTKFTENIYELDNKIKQCISHPLVIGPNCKYKTFHEFINFINDNMDNLIIFKEKIYSLHKEFKNKTETNMNSYKLKLDYLLQNCNISISSKIREVEQEIKKNLNETLYVELEKINKNFENQKENLEKKILNINEKLQKIDILQQNFEKIEVEMNKKIELIKEKQIFHHEKNNKYYTGSKNNSIYEEHLKNKKLLYKKCRSYEENSLILRDINDNISKFSKSSKEIKTEPNRDKFSIEETSISEDSEIENDLELRKNKIKDKINNILFNNVKTYKELKKLQKGKNKYISNFLGVLYPNIIHSSLKMTNIATPKKCSNNNNKINLLNNFQNFSTINKDLLIINNKEIKVDNSLQLLKSNSQPFLNNTNKEKINDVADIKDTENTSKKQSEDSFSSGKIMNCNKKNKNKINENKALISLSFKQNSKDRLFLKINNKNNNQNQKNKSNFFNKQNQNDNMNKSVYNKQIIYFPDIEENNKEKDEQKIKKIFLNLKGNIQEDEKFLVKNRFINYGYNKDIIFILDKRHYINRNEENKNNSFRINNNDLKVRPYSKSFKRH